MKKKKYLGLETVPDRISFQFGTTKHRFNCIEFKVYSIVLLSISMCNLRAIVCISDSMIFLTSEKT